MIKYKIQGKGFKASQKTGQRLKVSSDRLGEAGNRACDPWFTRHRFIPYTTAASLVLLNKSFDQIQGICVLTRNLNYHKINFFHGLRYNENVQKGLQ